MLEISTRWGALLGIAIGGVFSLFGDCAVAQVIPDGTLPNNSSVQTERSSFNITGGTQAGSNLFHSFREFSVPTNSTALFNNTADIQNIISRVTGNSISNIDGLIRSLGTANLFLINPNGIIFGQNARLDIGGSFFATSANSMKFADGFEFSATDPKATPLLTISVPTGLQYANNASSVEVRESSLQVTPGKTLALVGGNVSIDAGQLLVPGGRVELGGVAGNGNIGLAANDGQLRLTFPQEVSLTDVLLTNGAQVNVSARGDGSIAVNAQRLNISGSGTRVQAGIDSELLSTGRRGNIEFNAKEVTNIDGGVISNVVLENGVGNAGDINITTGSLIVSNGGKIETSTFGQGNAGNLRINARDTIEFTNGAFAFSQVEREGVGDGGEISMDTGSLSVSNGSQLRTWTTGKGNAGSVNIIARDAVSFQNGGAVFSTVEPNAIGNGNNIRIQAKSLSVVNGSFLTANTLGQGNAGNVTIDARDSVVFERGTATSSVGVPEFGAGFGNGGDVRIKTGSLRLSNNARLLASSSKGRGNAGNVNVEARDTVSLSDESFIFSQLEGGSTGNGGNINISTGSLSVVSGSILSSDIFGVGNGGNISINARDNVSFLTEGGAYSLVNSQAVGDGGNIDINTGSLVVGNGSFMAASILGKGNAGTITINATDSISLDGLNRKGFPGGIYSEVARGGVGKGGNININTRSLSVTNGAQIVTDIDGRGSAGTVNINATDFISFDGVGKNVIQGSGQSSGAYSSVGLQEGVGNGGNINIFTRSLSLTNGAAVITNTLGQGNAGNVKIIATDNILIDGASSNSLPSAVKSVVETGSVGDGGEIDITSKLLQVTNFGEISSSSEGNGTAGNMTLNARSIRLNNDALLTANTRSAKVVPNREQATININSQDLIMSRNSNIFTNATGENVNGGNINIDTDFLIGFKNSDISANSANFRGGNVRINATGIFGTQFRNASTPNSDITATGGSPELSGTVQINTPEIDLNSGLVNLPSVPVDTKIAQTCTEGNPIVKSQFIITGRGGLPPNPGEVLNTDAVQVDLVTLNPEVDKRSTTVSTNPTSRTPDRIVEATGWLIDADGNVVLTANPTAITPHSSWQKIADCRAFNQQHKH
ncbi:hypothetical protein DP113_05215 [Brasilonema octagenarum UFV-E1]|uniref:Filamentous haemagglutinin FhaB/tRNA nuclease CdiA-like TPS domain-containing protein n=1 Tax=Brasilonema sennae CENA114 TaxID=415709 RepID=A0A856MBE3_9CYAN|nr:filamentous hemagglutinin N-terminal domain-containing protein [Brasilonema sennae]QDL07389.1 hypothetical protein DP114_05265 [Brasilonema sennae CENA114]QDL13751.1 hypothetical protein DP113_05215 [Brasilonema octagenarum UFV-E1]